MPSELKCRIIRARILRDDVLNHSSLQGQGSDFRMAATGSAAHHEPLEIICELKFNEEV